MPQTTILRGNVKLSIFANYCADNLRVGPANITIVNLNNTRKGIRANFVNNADKVALNKR